MLHTLSLCAFVLIAQSSHEAIELVRLSSEHASHADACTVKTLPNLKIPIGSGSSHLLILQSL